MAEGAKNPELKPRMSVRLRYSRTPPGQRRRRGRRRGRMRRRRRRWKRGGGEKHPH